MGDYNLTEKKCHCTAHPCHHDTNEMNQRVVHSCTDPNLPFLGFEYLPDGKLQCKCQKTDPISSVYIAKVLCPGHTCEDGNDLLLDYDETKKSCICSRHPCKNDGGIEHKCTDPKFPLLKYHYEEDGKLKCSCFKDFKVR